MKNLKLNCKNKIEKWKKKKLESSTNCLRPKMKFFGTMSQVYWFNMVLFLVAFLLVAVVINYYFSKQSQSYHMDYNYSVMKGIEGLLIEQEEEFSELLINSYMDKVWESCKSEDPETGEPFYDSSKVSATVKNFLYDKFHTSYGCMAVFFNSIDRAYVYQDRMYSYSGDNELLSIMREAYTDYQPHLIMTADTISNHNRKDRTYSLTYCLRDAETYQNIGSFQLEYKTEEIDTLIKSSYPSVKGEFLIVTDSGEVFYDSSGQWYGKEYPYIDKVLSDLSPKKSVSLGEKKYYINSFGKGLEFYPHLYIFGMIPSEEINKDVRTTLEYMTYILLTVILISSFAMFLNISKKSVILKRILFALRKARKGDLDARVEIESKTQNEFTEIAAAFNGMAEKLNDYIQREYKMKLEQQQYQLMTLQAQINPHFLYNSFESIRMKAVIDDEEEIEEMVMILSKIFRNTAKGDGVLSIGLEVENCKNFLRLHEIRFQDRLSYKLDVPEEVREYMIVQHALQVIIENYIIYSFDSERYDNEIRIVGEKQDEWIVVEISDNSTGITDEKLEEMREQIRDIAKAGHRRHIGLSNVSQRMRIVFGEDFTFTVDLTEAGGLVEQLRFRAYKEEELHNALSGNYSR